MDGVMCAKCGIQPPGDGGVLCPDCTQAITARTFGYWGADTAEPQEVVGDDESGSPVVAASPAS